MTFAVIKTGGKQYIVKEGRVITIEKLTHDGDKVIFDEVLLVANLPDGKAGEKTAAIGQPLVKGAKVTGTVLEEGKTRYHKKKGHRQLFTKVKINKITA